MAGLFATDQDMLAYLVNGENLVEVRDAMLGRGWDSETGAANFGPTTFLYNHLCGNHTVSRAKEAR